MFDAHSNKRQRVTKDKLASRSEIDSEAPVNNTFGLAVVSPGTGTVQYILFDAWSTVYTVRHNRRQDTHLALSGGFLGIWQAVWKCPAGHNKRRTRASRGLGCDHRGLGEDIGRARFLHILMKAGHGRPHLCAWYRAWERRWVVRGWLWRLAPSLSCVAKVLCIGTKLRAPPARQALVSKEEVPRSPRTRY